MSVTYIMSSINDSRLAAYTHEVTEQHFLGLHNPISSSVTNLVYSHLTWSTLWFSLLCLFVAFNLKHMPFMWHMRILNAFRFILHTQRPAVAPSPAHIFQPLITSSSAQLMELDFNMHKSNSSYFADVDIARTHLVCTLFAAGIARMRGGTAAYTGSARPLFGLALGAVSCSFRRELRPYQAYDMWSRVLAWDDKWIYVVTHFVHRGAEAPAGFSLYPEQQEQQQSAAAAGGDDGHDGRLSSSSSSGNGNGAEKPAQQQQKSPVYATALSKCVFKSGRRTVSPHDMLEMSGLLPTSSTTETTKPGAAATITPEQIEAQRQRGMRTAQLLATQNQQDLEAEFTGGGSEALGRHTDGAGIVGVVNTLMQLAGVRKAQVL